MLNILGFGHISIVVDCIKTASDFYQQVFNAIPVQYFPHFKNKGFAKAAGFLDDPESVEVSINFLKIPQAEIYLELTCYHQPPAIGHVQATLPHTLGGPRHIALRVKDIQTAFKNIKSLAQVKLMNLSPQYQPHQLDTVCSNQFSFYDAQLEANAATKQQAADVSSQISFFYFTDPYGVTWELEEAPDHIDDPALSV